MQKKLFAVIDTETIDEKMNDNTTQNAKIFDIACRVVNGSGKLIEEKAYLVLENYNKMDRPKVKSYYGIGNKERYEEMQENGTIKTVSNEVSALARIETMLQRKGRENICLVAYNTAFDFERTKARELLKGHEFLDLYYNSLRTICQEQSYIDYCIDNLYMNTTTGNISTSAETVMRYIGDTTEEEEHTALADATIETAILVYLIENYQDKLVFNKHQKSFSSKLVYNFGRVVKKNKNKKLESVKK